MERERITNERNQAGAGLLQRHYRGHQARKAVGEKRQQRYDDAVDVLQRGGRVFIARKKVDGERTKQKEGMKNAAAKTVTKFFRLVAGISRGKRIRQITIKFMMEVNCVKLQCFVRQRLAHRAVRQSLYMKKFAARLCAIINIQRIGRGYLAKGKFAKREEEVRMNKRATATA